MDTEQEFKEAQKLLNECVATLSCGCEVNEQDADCLYYFCKSYIKEFNKKFCL